MAAAQGTAKELKKLTKPWSDTIKGNGDDGLNDFLRDFANGF